MAEILNVTIDNFKEEVLEAEKPVVILFKSPGCPHCVKMMPVFEETAQEYGQQMKFGIVDITENSQLAEEYDILSIPVAVFFIEGEETRRLTGGATKEILEAKIKKTLMGQ